MAIRIAESIYAIPIVDNETDLFESLWPLDDGVNYNSYVVIGSEGAAIIDTVHESFFEQYLEELQSVVDLNNVKYIVINHMEPDHSSSLSLLLEHAPNAKIVISQIGATMFKLPGDVIQVKDGDEICLGNKTLKFISTPWTHWPETMVTYVPEDRVLFTCDLFGAYGAYSDLLVDDWDGYLLEARRYYVTVLSRYAKFVRSAVAKINALKPEVIAPGHGIVYSGDRLDQILNLYADWSSGHKEGRVLILYGSMYGSIYDRVHTLLHLLEAEGVEVDALDLSREDWSYAMTFVLGADVVVVAYPTYDADVFPPVKFFLRAVKDKGLLEGKKIFVIEAHGWSSSEQKIRQLLDGLEIATFLSFSQKQPLKIESLESLVEQIVSALSSDE